MAKRRTKKAAAPEPEPVEVPEVKLTLAQKKRLKQKQRKQAKKAEREELKQAIPSTTKPSSTRKQDVEIEYVSAPLEAVLADIAPIATDGMDVDNDDHHANDNQPVDEFKKILEHFGNVEQLLGKEQQFPNNTKTNDATAATATTDAAPRPSDVAPSDDDADANENAANGTTDLEILSKKKKKEITRPKIAQLKQRCERPEVVEVWDVAAADPELLVYLKSYRNTVPIPRHWSQKRNYLQGKRGIEKPPFKLPAFIEATGITEMRQAYLEKADAQNTKAKGRERAKPKMGKLDIDYQILHDAFFKHQTKPPLSLFGDLYYEGKEYEAQVRHARPGVLSKELQEALDMTPNSPMPWLLSMQRYGPPPSYPSLKIPGLNAPIPPGASFGYHTGGWGKPPVDEYGQPLYGNVFGQYGGVGADNDGDDDDDAPPIVTSHWGDLYGDEESEEESEEEEEESEEEEEEERKGVEEGEEGEEEQHRDGYTSTMSGIASSLPGGLETPTEVQLRKAQEMHAAAAPEGQKVLYHVLEQKKASVVGGAGIMGSDHTYELPVAEGGAGGKGKKLSITAAKRLEALRREMPTDLDIAIDPSDLEMLDDESLKELYEMRLKEQRSAAGREDFSDLVAAKAISQKRKGSEKTGGKEKKFKF